MTAVEDLVPRILALCADPATGATFLDGGRGGRGFVAAFPERTVEGEALDDLRLVEAVFEGRCAGMCAGHVTYDAGVAWLLGRTPRPAPVPHVLVRHYAAWAEIRDDRLAQVCGEGGAAARLRRALEGAVPHRPGPHPVGEPAAVFPPDVHRARVRRALEAIRAGQTYQVNLAQPFVAPWTQEEGRSLGVRAADLYAHLRAASPAALGAFYGAWDAFVVSNAPETLLAAERRGDRTRVRSLPIKGTRPRGTDPAEDRARAEELAVSAKDRAEHVMIVDLVRNDLGRVAEPGSVEADRTPRLTTLPTVHHLVSEVRAVLAPGRSLLEAFAASFPGGSVTGAPKRRTVEIIDALEDRARGVYCGAIFVATRGRFVASIPIRTGLVGRFGLELLAGGGIVADSDPEAERVETEVKTRAFRPPDGTARPGEGAS